MQEVTAKLNYLRMSPRKVRLVADLLRGRKVTTAVNTLTVLNKRAAAPLLKLLRSAIANAEHNHSLSMAGLRISSIMVNQGPALKRFMPKAHGRATPVREPTCHINLVLTGEKSAAAKDTKEVVEVAEVKADKPAKKARAKKS